MNICYLNTTSVEVNKACSDAFTKDKKYHKIKFLNAGKIESYKVSDGMPVICTTNMKGRRMYNSQTYNIKNITPNHVTIKENNEKFEMDDFTKNLPWLTVLLCISIKAPIHTLIYLMQTE